MMTTNQRVIEAVRELHRSEMALQGDLCNVCLTPFPCRTIQAMDRAESTSPSVSHAAAALVALHERNGKVTFPEDAAATVFNSIDIEDIANVVYENRVYETQLNYEFSKHLAEAVKSYLLTGNTQTI